MLLSVGPQHLYNGGELSEKACVISKLETVSKMKCQCQTSADYTLKKSKENILSLILIKSALLRAETYGYDEEREKKLYSDIDFLRCCTCAAKTLSRKRSENYLINTLDDWAHRVAKIKLNGQHNNRKHRGFIFWTDLGWDFGTFYCIVVVLWIQDICIYRVGPRLKIRKWKVVKSSAQL